MDNPWATSDPWRPEPQDTGLDDAWSAQWGTAETLSDHGEQETPPAPPEWLDAILSHCQQVSQEIWPPPESGNDGNWRSGFDDLPDIAALLAQLAPTDTALPPAVQFSATATAKAMNEALKLTRHLPMSASSPLSRLLASKGSLEWEKSFKEKQDVVPETTRVGWRVLEKDDRLSTLEELKPKRASSGFLSFWSRRVSATQPALVEGPRERSASPPRSSLESLKSLPNPPSSRAASPPKAPAASALPPPLADSHPTSSAAPAPSAVSRFLNRFSLARSTQHGTLALSSDDIEFLSDIVPSASDPPDDIHDGILGTLTTASSASSLPPKLPPPIPPPPRQPTPSGHPSIGVPGSSDDASVDARMPTISQLQASNYTPNIPVLAPPLSPNPASSFLRAQSSSSLNDAATPIIAFEQPSTSIQQRLQPDSRPRSLSPLGVLPLSLPPLLPPPPVSPPQTPRPNTFSSISPVHSSSGGICDPDESDDEFSAFTSFPAPASTPFPSSHSDPPLRSPSPPSPPPRRTYDRTHYPSSSSASSILSPASQSSADRLCSSKSSVSASLDGFDDFVSALPSQQENRKHTPSPPPLPAKSPFQHWQLPPIDTCPPRTPYSHTPSQSFASPTVHTSLMSTALSVSNVEHRRTQALVNHAAARGGLLWPNSPELEEPKMKAIPPPPSSTSPPPVLGERLDLLGDGNTLRGVDPLGLRAAFDDAGGPGKGLGPRNQLQPSPPPLPSMFSTTLAGTNTGSLPSTKPKQMGGLSAQDLSFFEGL